MKPDMFATALKLERWILKVSDYGDESVNYLNGDSNVFVGDAWKHLALLKKELRKSLAANGVKLGDQLSVISKGAKQP